jgi:hypothetical protein
LLANSSNADLPVCWSDSKPAASGILPTPG